MRVQAYILKTATLCKIVFLNEYDLWPRDPLFGLIIKYVSLILEEFLLQCYFYVDLNICMFVLANWA